jgi:HAD superfamily phosphatase (TIGR01668 family)
MVKKFIPDLKAKTVFDINYDELINQGHDVFVFDLDNTLAIFDTGQIDQKTENLLNELKQKTNVVIFSNNSKAIIEKFVKSHDLKNIKVIGGAKKPFKKNYLVLAQEHTKPVYIGDQLLTDIFGANRSAVYFTDKKAVLVDPLVKKDSWKTNINRRIERLIKRRIERKGYFEFE